MVVGVPKEIKPEENRIAIVPGGVETLVNKGHQVIIERGAGLRSGFSDEEYIRAGAQILEKHEDVLTQADLLLKVKEPVPEEYEYLKEGQVVFTYLHLGASEELTRNLERKLGYPSEKIEDLLHILPTIWVPKQGYASAIDKAKNPIEHEEDVPVLAVVPHLWVLCSCYGRYLVKLRPVTMARSYHVVAVLRVLSVRDTDVKRHVRMKPVVRLNGLSEHISAHVVVVRRVEYDMHVRKR